MVFINEEFYFSLVIINAALSMRLDFIFINYLIDLIF